jgi:mRNA interferase RelE/StbE
MYKLDKIPSKVENFIKNLDKQTQSRLNGAFDYILELPFKHNNPTVIKRLHGKMDGYYRYRLGSIRFVYHVDRDKKLIKILEIDNRGDIY